MASKWWDKMKKSFTESIGETRKKKKQANRYTNTGLGASKDEANKELDKEFNQVAKADEYEE